MLRVNSIGFVTGCEHVLFSLYQKITQHITFVILNYTDSLRDGTLVCHLLRMLQAWVHIQVRVIYFDPRLIFQILWV